MARDLWPDLAKAGLLPEATEAVVAEMVADFKYRHRGGKIAPSRIKPLIKRGLTLAAIYPRYSDDNSQPTSIIDQARNELNRAKQEGHFVPWCFCYADYALTGLNETRQGYTSLKAVIRDADHPVHTVYIDEFSRASRNAVEWIKLAALCKRLNVRMVGASDGFHIDDEDWDTKLAFYNLYNGMETKSKRRRVRRGMRGAAEENRVLGKLPLGYTRRVKRDAAGNVELKTTGQPRHERCFDPQTKQYARQMFERVMFEGWTPYAVMQWFNGEKVDGWEGWTEKAIRKLLVNPAYIGLFIWYRTRREYNPETDKTEVLPNKWTEWGLYYDPAFAIIPKSWHVAMRQRFEKDRKTRGTQTRRGKTAKTLFDGTLVCGYCKNEHGEPTKLTLFRSTEKYKDMHCTNGARRAHGCGLTTSKAVRIIEESLLGYIREHLFNEEVVRALVEKANAHLAEEAARPREDLAPLKAQIRQRERAIKRFLRLTETASEAADEDDDEVEDEELLQDYLQRVKELRKEVNDLRKQLQAKEARNADPPPPLDLNRVGQYVADLRDVLNQDIPASAEALRALTGQIRIHQEKIPDRKRGATWIATFSPNLLNLLAQIAKKKGYPESMTLEHLKQRIWIKEEPVHVTVQRLNVVDQIADAVVAALNAGTPREQVAKEHGVDPTTVDRAWRLRVHGIDRSDYDPSLKAFSPPRRATRPEEVMDQVAALRHEEGLDLKQIAQRLDLPVRVVGDAHRLWHEQHPDGPGDIPWVVLCGKAGKLTPTQRRQVCELALAGWREHQIVEKLPFEKGHVHKVLEALRREQERRGQGSS